MKKLLLLIATIPLMAVQCSEEETPVADCNCDRVEYQYGVWQFQPDGITPIWSYKEVNRLPTELNCDSESTNYIPIAGNRYFKIECD
jgi:hypothetical protein